MTKRWLSLLLVLLLAMPVFGTAAFAEGEKEFAWATAHSSAVSVEVGKTYTDLVLGTYTMDSTADAGNAVTAINALSSVAANFTTAGVKLAATNVEAVVTVKASFTVTSAVPAVADAFSIPAVAKTIAATKPALFAVAQPVITATPQTDGSVKVTMTSATTGATIKYNYGLTTNGVADPTPTSGTVYAEGGFTVTTPGAYTVRAIAYKSGLVNSALATPVTLTVTINPVSVTIDPSVTTLSGYDVRIFKANVTPAAASQQVTWTVFPQPTPDANISVERLDDGTFKVTGLGNASLDAAGEKYTVTATTTANIAVQADAQLLVVKQAVTGTNVPDSVTVAVGETAVLKANVLPIYATVRNMTLKAPTVSSFTVAGPATAEADDDGICTWKLTGVTAGTYVVPVTAENGMGKNITVNVVATSKTAPAPIFSKPSGTVFTEDQSKVVISCAAPYTKVNLRYSVDNGATWTENQSADVTINVDNNSAKTVMAQAVPVDGQGYDTKSAVVIASYTSVIPVAMLTLDPAGPVTLSGSESVDVTATAKGLKGGLTEIDPKDATVTFTSSNPAVAAIGYKEGDTSKTIATLKAVAPGTAKITVASTDGKKTATLDVTVNALAAKSIKLFNGATEITSASNFGINAGEYAQLTAKVYGEGDLLATNQNVVWTMADSTAASVNAGKVVGLKAGATTTLNVKSAENATISLDKTIIVEATAPTRVAAPVITVSGTLVAGKYTSEVVLKATTVTDGATLHYTINGSVPTQNDAVLPAEGIKISGLASAYVRVVGYKTGLASSVESTVNLSIAIPVAKLVMQPTATVAMKDTLTIPVTMTPDTASDKNIQWTSSAPTIATVNQTTGLITPVAPGVAVITAASKSNPLVTAACVLTVTENPVVSLEMMPATLTMNVFESQQVAYRAVRQTKSTAGVWTSSDPTVASVSQSGNISAVKAGSATITVTVDGKVGTVAVSVLADPTTIPAIPGAPTFAAKTKLFTAVSEGSLNAVLGTLVPAAGTTLDQLFYYYDVTVASTELTKLDLSTNFVVGKDGTISVNVPEVGKTSRFFDYTITFTAKNSRTATTIAPIDTANNTLTITPKPVYSLKVTDKKLAKHSIYTSDKDYVVVGVVENIAELAAAGKAVTADVAFSAVDPKADLIAPFTANVTETGSVALNYNKVPAGVYEVVVTVKGADMASVVLEKIVVTATEKKTDDYQIVFPIGYLYETVSANNYKLAIAKKAPVQLSLNEGVATNWKSSNKKVVTVNASGLLTFKKTGKAYITCTNELGTETSMAIQVVKPSKELKLQFTLKPAAKNPKYVTIKTGTTITLPVDGSLAVRAVNKAPSGAKPMAITWVMADETIANVPNHANNYAQLMGVKEGTTTLTLMNAFGATLTFNVQVVSLTDEAAKGMEVEEGIQVKGGMKEVD